MHWLRSNVTCMGHSKHNTLLTSLLDKQVAFQMGGEHLIDIPTVNSQQTQCWAWSLWPPTRSCPLHNQLPADTMLSMVSLATHQELSSSQSTPSRHNVEHGLFGHPPGAVLFTINFQQTHGSRHSVEHGLFGHPPGAVLFTINFQQTHGSRQSWAWSLWPPTRSVSSLDFFRAHLPHALTTASAPTPHAQYNYREVISPRWQWAMFTGCLEGRQ